DALTLVRVRLATLGATGLVGAASLPRRALPLLRLAIARALRLLLLTLGALLRRPRLALLLAALRLRATLRVPLLRLLLPATLGLALLSIARLRLALLVLRAT